MKIEAAWGSLRIGDDYSVRLMGVINVSPESFYKGSVYVKPSQIVEAALRMEKEGADIIDVGAMSTAPYLKTEISPQEEARRLSRAIAAIREQTHILISADTTRSYVAEEACRAGADVLNDVTGFKGDAKMRYVARDHGVGLLLMAHESKPVKGTPIRRVRALLSESLEVSSRHNIEPKRVVLDPGIGFFRQTPWSWHQWDSYILKHIGELRALGRPTAVAVSRKSFIGEILKQANPEDRLHGTLAAEAIAVLNGVHIVRTHDVASTREAVRLAEFIRRVPLLRASPAQGGEGSPQRTR